MSDIFFIRLGRRGNLFANLSRVVMEGSRELGKRLERQDEGSWTDLKNLRDSCSRRSVRLGMAASGWEGKCRPDRQYWQTTTVFITLSFGSLTAKRLRSGTSTKLDLE